ncbi:formate dehydrogenase accessory sulfurtransferase FdhD [Thiomonas sp.]|uniref:formate dehydrogenase accessory sulfurtransferase FdhD n=1 Tax=Thiomonas sp. TaxID=2047785 RepID=UPI002604866E|nr:formate dehydrogenase accessory sulfurtransferase FdhD [Thiomonas sp.]
MSAGSPRARGHGDDSRGPAAAICEGARSLDVLRWRGGHAQRVDDWLSEEVAVALQYNGVSHAVMLATPLDLEDFALGFSLGEGIVERSAEVYDCEIVREPRGLTLQIEVAARCFERLRERRRSLTGRTGCGLCGTDSLEQALRPLRPLPARPELPIGSSAVARALGSLREHQRLNAATGAVHAAGWCDARGRLLLVREDVGRHNALDKLIGAMARCDTDAASGFAVITSRASVEMVQKAAQAGMPMLVAVSAPTALAVRSAREVDMCLVGLARGDDLVVYSGAQRIALEPSPDFSTSLLTT